MRDTSSLCGLCGVENDGSPALCPSCGGEPLVAGRYVLLGVLGRGGTGVTWRARRHPDGVLVCLKELRWDRMGSFKDEELFHREAQILRTLDHPQIPVYLDEMAWPEEVGPRHALWLAQELVDGRSLEAERRERRYTLDDILAVGESVAGVLAYLAEQRPPVAHRDLKPGNIMRQRDGTLMLVDFGAARASGLVETGGTTVAGTFGYMAPEQMRGEATPASDVYGLGMTLAVLFAGVDPEALLDETNRPDLVRVSGLTPGFRALLEDMLATGPSARPTAREVMRRVQSIRRGDAPRVPREVRAAPAVSVPATPPRVVVQQVEARSSPLARIIVLTTAVATLAIVGYVVFSVTSTIDTSLEMARENARAAMERSRKQSADRVPAQPVASAPVPEPEIDPAVEAKARAAGEAERKRLEADLRAATTKRANTSCAGGDAGACEELWRAYSGEDEQAVLALGLPATLASACDKGLARACGLRGTLAFRGAGVPEDHADGRKWSVRACDGGDLEACALAGRMLIDGEAGPVDAKKGVEQLQKACDGGNDVACMNVGVALARGQGIAADRARALKIFEDCCRKGQSLACDNLGGVVGNNWGLPSDAKARFETLARLCDLRIGTACARAGDAAAAGKGTAKDAAVALDYRRRACNLGVNELCGK